MAPKKNLCVTRSQSKVKLKSKLSVSKQKADKHKVSESKMKSALKKKLTLKKKPVQRKKPSTKALTSKAVKSPLWRNSSFAAKQISANLDAAIDAVAAGPQSSRTDPSQAIKECTVTEPVESSSLERDSTLLIYCSSVC